MFQSKGTPGDWGADAVSTVAARGGFDELGTTECKRASEKPNKFIFFSLARRSFSSPAAIFSFLASGRLGVALGCYSASSDSRSLSSKPTYNANGNLKPVAEKPKKAPRTRPKLTPEILLKDDGLGFVLRHFPRNFKYHGRGHEVSDLGNLIGLYSEWHSRLLPYYSFDQFVNKVEQVAATKRVKRCHRDLRERVASGGDPTKLRESRPEDADPNTEQDHSIPAEGLNSDGFHHEGDLPSKSHDADVTHEDMLHELFDKAVDEETPQTAQRNVEVSNENAGGSSSSEVPMTDEQKARMEANRLKALEKAAARARSLQSI